MCYTVPLVAAITTGFCWRKTISIKTWWLVLMFCGGSVFGVIDHLWNGELFLISKYWLKDLILGVVITGTILLTWKIALVLSKRNLFLNTYLVGLEEK